MPPPPSKLSRLGFLPLIRRTNVADYGRTRRASSDFLRFANFQARTRRFLLYMFFFCVTVYGLFDSLFVFVLWLCRSDFLHGEFFCLYGG